MIWTVIVYLIVTLLNTLYLQLQLHSGTKKGKPSNKKRVSFLHLHILMFRRCDSHNLNLSPLCNLQSDTKPSLWQQEVVETYKSVDGTLPNYVKVKYSLRFQSSKQWPLWNSVDATLVNMAPHSGKNSAVGQKMGEKSSKVAIFDRILTLI